MALGLPFLLLLGGLLGPKTNLTSYIPTRPTRPRPRPKEAAPPGVTPAAAPPPTPKVVPVAHNTAVQVQPPPWPQVVPAGLPPFPGASWVPDEPPGAGVVPRATALLPELWRYGQGTFKTEQVNGRWITFRATPMGTKKGVVAFRLVEVTATPGTAEVLKPSMPGMPEHDWTSPERVPPTVPASAPTPAAAPSVSLRTLRLLSPRMTGDDVKTVQRKLGLADDGVYGTGSVAAVKAFQSQKGLNPDGVVGPKTWAALYGTVRA